MKISAFTSFVCPVDRLPLIKTEKILRCEGGHSYDLAAQGYCNLLLVQQKASLDPGDNKDMVAARGRFLDSGHFAPIVDKLFEEVCVLLNSQKRSLRIVDAGCGEGYYLDQLSKRALESKLSGNLELAGFDISKWAVKAAAKRTNEIAWAVAGNKNFPFTEVDLILSMFGYPDWKSFKAALAKGGRVLLIDPGPNHLIELRKIIYPTVTTSEAPSIAKALECGFILEKEEAIKFFMNLKTNAQIQDLLSMTPHGFRITEKAYNHLGALNQLTVSVDLVFRILHS